jgi:hypothetical protein
VTAILRIAAVASSVAAAALAVAGTPTGLARAEGPPRCTFPAPGMEWLPAACKHGPIQYLREYPLLRLATPDERGRARLLRDQLLAAAEAGKWRDLEAAARAGYRTHRTPRKPGDQSVHYFHAERPPEARVGGILNARRPKALIYANAPGRPLVLVGAMWSTRPGERGPTPGGPITRWHSHFICADAHGMTSAAANGRCPAGMHLRLGRNEMLHIWFTGDLRSAFATRAPEPELCAGDLLPSGYCLSLKMTPIGTALFCINHDRSVRATRVAHQP